MAAGGEYGSTEGCEAGASTQEHQVSRRQGVLRKEVLKGRAWEQEIGLERKMAVFCVEQTMAPQYPPGPGPASLLGFLLC